MPTNNKFTDFTGQDFFIGLDVHKSSWFVTIRTLGLEIAHFSQTPDPVQLARHLNSKYPGGHFISTYEAGFCGTNAHNALCQLGIE
jgi:transposase